LLSDLARDVALEEVQERLMSTSSQPTEVTPRLRAAHVLSLALAWFFPLISVFGTFLIVCGGPPASEINDLHKQVESMETNLQGLEEQSKREEMMLAMSPDPFLRAAAVHLRGEDVALARKVNIHLDYARRFHDALDREAGFFPHLVARQQQEQSNSGSGNSAVPADVRTEKPVDFRTAARAEATFHPETIGLTGDAVMPFLILTSVMPLVWIIWAFIFRGGITLWLVGILLQRSNGRKALRIQCAWRALLIWTPVVLLLGIALWLQVRFWVAWAARQNLEGGGPDAFLTFESWLSWACWWAALALLPLYAVLAIRFPNRCLHDYLAGTYLVPK
jgi:hypothetical protein